MCRGVGEQEGEASAAGSSFRRWCLSSHLGLGLLSRHEDLTTTSWCLRDFSTWWSEEPGGRSTEKTFCSRKLRLSIEAVAGTAAVSCDCLVSRETLSGQNNVKPKKKVVAAPKVWKVCDGSWGDAMNAMIVLA